MVVILGYGIWFYNARFNELWNFRRLAQSIERHAGEVEAGMFGVRWFPLDFYLGRQVRWIGTAPEFQAYLGREDRPLGVVNGRTWRRIQGQIVPEIRVLEQRSLGGQDVLILRHSGPEDDWRLRPSAAGG